MYKKKKYVIIKNPTVHVRVKKEQKKKKMIYTFSSISLPV